MAQLNALKERITRRDYGNGIVGKAVKGAKVLLMGLAYKKDVDDPRESPAFKILTLLVQKGALAVDA